MLGLCSLAFIVTIYRFLVMQEFKNKWGVWISRHDHPLSYWLVLVYLSLIAAFFLYAALSPNKKARA